ncbi:hypothetical protein LX36DRAFT_653988 [Colletotrichum falcatum]|nr:hypothetical protein LX36DRAFT_653988 [Colletotrichum falcatum]
MQVPVLDSRSTSPSVRWPMGSNTTTTPPPPSPSPSPSPSPPSPQSTRLQSDAPAPSRCACVSGMSFCVVSGRVAMDCSCSDSEFRSVWLAPSCLCLVPVLRSVFPML